MIHETAIVEAGVQLGKDVAIWHFAHIRKGASLGNWVSIGKDSYVDAGVQIGEGSRIQNHVSVFSGVLIKDWVFVGPSVVFTNDLLPRVGNKAWRIVETIISTGASLGAGAVIRCGVTIGEFAMIGAGALVTKSVSPFTLVLGHPAEGYKRVCACGQSISDLANEAFNPIQPCCKVNMRPEMFEVAIRYVNSEYKYNVNSN